MCDTMGKLFEHYAIFAKNSDRSPNEPQVVEYFEAKVHTDKKVKTTYVEVDQVEKTKAFILSRPIWLWGGEMGVNECGVCIGNEAVFTKGKYKKTGLTGMDMVRLALERSGNAKEALQCIIDLLEKYGQGGNCGYDHDFFYDNSFLIMDKTNIFILETAGKEWVYKKVKQGAISNRLSIREDGDVYSHEKCDFVKKHLEPVYSYFSKSKQRQSMCASAIENANKLEDIFKAMRQHSHDDNPMAKASVSSPCMHYGSFIGDHTTQSMIVELLENGQIRIWVTGSSLPCMSIFKPFLFGNECVKPIFKETDDYAKNYWIAMEQFQRELLGKKIPDDYYKERDEIEMALIEQVKNADALKMFELSKKAFCDETAFINKWKNIKLDNDKVSYIFKNNWKKKTKILYKYITDNHKNSGG